MAPASAFARDQFDAGVLELRQLGFEPVYSEASSPATDYLAGSGSGPGSGLSCRLDRSNDRCGDRRARRIRKRPFAAVPGRRDDTGPCQGVPRLQRQHLASDLAQAGLRPGRVSRTDARAAGSQAAQRDTIGTRSCAASAGRSRSARSPTASKRSHRGEGGGSLVGGTLTQLRPRSVPIGVRPAGRVRALPRRGGRAAVSARPHADAAAACGILSRASAASCSALPRCDEPGGSRRARETVRPCSRIFRGRSSMAFRRATPTAVADASVWRHRAAWSPGPESSAGHRRGGCSVNR